MKNPVKNAIYSLLHDRGHFKSALLRRMPWLVPDDRKYLGLMYKFQFGEEMDWDNPQTFNAKLQWLKLYDHNPMYTMMVDKYAVKDWVAKVIGEEYVIPTIGVWNNPDDIEWESLPNQFVLKTTHDGGGHGVVVCHDKSALNRTKAIAELWDSYKRSSYAIGREWPYKDVPHRIIAEKYMEDEHGELRDYKYFAFNGVVQAMFIATERGSGDVKIDFYDADFNHLDLVQVHPMSNADIEKPISFELMKQLASKLSVGIPQVRVDFYEVNGHPYFGEMTFSHHGGFTPFHPHKWDEIFGSWITLPKEKKI